MPASPIHSHRRLCVAMIVRNAADSIVQSLESVRDVADEIVVVDTGSTDRTRDLAVSRSTRVLDFVWCDDFSAARNFCLDQITGDWVFWLDTGERLADEAARTLRAFVDSQADARTAYLVMVQVPPGPSQACGQQAARLRLLPNHPEIRFAGRVREDINAAIASLDTSVKLAPVSIQRTVSEHDPVTIQSRASRNCASGRFGNCREGTPTGAASGDRRFLRQTRPVATRARFLRPGVEAGATRFDGRT